MKEKSRAVKHSSNKREPFPYITRWNTIYVFKVKSQD